MHIHAPSEMSWHFNNVAQMFSNALMACVVCYTFLLHRAYSKTEKNNVLFSVQCSNGMCCWECHRKLLKILWCSDGMCTHTTHAYSVGEAIVLKILLKFFQVLRWHEGCIILLSPSGISWNLLLNVLMILQCQVWCITHAYFVEYIVELQK